MTYLILYKTPDGKKLKKEVSSENAEKAIHMFRELFPELLIYYVIHIPDWEDEEDSV